MAASDSEEDPGAASASGFSDLSDSEFLLLEEPEDSAPQLVDSAKPSSSSELPRVSTGTNVTENGGGLKEKRKRSQTPLEKYFLKYLCVTDISTQSWCEQQMVYGRERPELQPPERVSLLDAGKSIHLARELEVHNLVSVRTTSKEDSWAIKLLNLLSMIPVLQTGHRVREFPVFGEIGGVFLVGIIDELHYTAKGELELNELKTRRRLLMPSKAQIKKDSFQVCLYKYIFDSMVQGQLKPENFTSHIGLRPEQPLGLHIKAHAQKAGFTVASLKELLDLAFLNLTLSDIPNIDRLKIEYIHQESNALLGTEEVPYERDQVSQEVQYYLAYWKGQRDVRGVDIEEAWKCNMCAYSSICEWRQDQVAEGPFQRSGSKKSK